MPIMIDENDHMDSLDREQAKLDAEIAAEAVLKKPILPEDSAARKEMPMATGVLDYFPRALAYVAKVSKIGNDKHNPGQPLHWSKGKSDDHADTIVRHLVDRGTKDSQKVRHSGYLAWRSLANLEIELEEAEKRGEPW